VSATVPRRARRPLAVGAALVLVALNLRFGIAAVPPVLDDIRRGDGLSGAGAGALTTLPVLCFGLAAPLAPVLGRRIPQEVLLGLCVVAVAAGISLRLAPPVAALFAGTALLGTAIAVANVLMPSVIKRRFARPGVMMGLYTTSFSVAAALAGGLTVPLESALGSWRVVLALWALPALAAAALWLSERRAPGDGPAAEDDRRVRLGRNRTAWLITGAFGLQSLLFYALLSWLPDLLHDAGLSAARAGAMLSIAMLLGLPTSLVLPELLARARDERGLALLPPVLYAAGFAGLLAAPATATPLWMALLGLAQGAGISVTLAYVVQRSPDAAHAASLSGMAQGYGYVLAAAGPFAVGALHDLSGGWRDPILLLLAVTAGFAACVLTLARRP
jgi:CP family cyanate transporter-like MFS transporter